MDRLKVLELESLGMDPSMAGKNSRIRSKDGNIAGNTGTASEE